MLDACFGRGRSLLPLTASGLLLLVSACSSDSGSDTDSPNHVEAGAGCGAVSPAKPSSSGKPDAGSTPPSNDTAGSGSPGSLAVDAGGTESGQTGNGPSDGDATAIEPPDAASDLPSPGPSEMSDASTLVSGSSSGTDAGSSSDSDVTGEQAPDDGAIGCGPASQCASQVTELESEGNMHVPEGSEVEYGHNPPASGPHYPVWAKFEAYDKVVPRSYWVHNLEHGGVVLLYGPNATQAEQDQLRAVYDQLSDFESCGTKFALLTPDPLLDDPIAVVAWTWVLEADCVDPTAINAFVEAHRGQGTEAVCGDGSFEP